MVLNIAHCPVRNAPTMNMAIKIPLKLVIVRGL